MKMTKKMISIIVLLVTAVACATTSPPVLPDRYNLDNDLKSVKRIPAAHVSNWVQVDNQSFIFAANGNHFYLAVLDRPLESIFTNQKIGFVDKGLSIAVGYDRICIKDSSSKAYYTIEKIYALKGIEQAKKIKRLLGKK